MLVNKYKIKSSFFIVLLLAGGYTLFGQNITKDSIDLYFKNVKEFNEGFNSEISKLCKKIRTQDNELALLNYMDSITTTNPRLKLLFYHQYVQSFYRNNKSDEGIKKASIAIDIATKFNYTKKLIELNKIKSFGFISISKMDSALHYANVMENLILTNKDKFGEHLYQLYALKTDIEGLMGNFRKQDDFFEKAVESIEEYPDIKNTPYVLATTAYHFKINKNYEKHSIYSQKLKAYYQKQGGYSDPENHGSISNYLEFENSEKQIEALKRVIDSSNQSPPSFAQQLNINTLTESLLSINQPEEAVKYIKLNTESDSFPLIHKIRSLYYLEKAYEQLDDCDNTLITVNKKVVLIDSLRSKEMIAKIADSKVKYETEKKEAQLQILKLEKEKEKQKKNLSIIIAVLGMILVALVSYFLYRNNRKNKTLNTQNELLERTVDEKNVLLREVHHRVKNSFQIVSSLLYLQSENITDAKAKRAIKEAENRVRSMVLVHQKLYNKEELVGIDTKEYFEDLIKDIFDSHDVRKEPIAYNLNIEPLVLDIETITPLGLILNELIINTMKHAFDGVEKNQKIDVNFIMVEDKLELVVSDNGKGFEGELKQSSFGIILMKALSKQLKATLSHSSKKNVGTEVKLIIDKFNIL